MFLDFDKESENNTTVSYWIKTTFFEETSSGVNKTIVKGLCIFNKETNTMIFDPDKTDSFFFERKSEPIYILYYLRQLNRSKRPFPQEYCIATG